MLADLAVEVEEGLVYGDEIADLGRKLDDTVGSLRFGDECCHVYRQDDAGGALVKEGAVRRVAFHRLDGGGRDLLPSPWRQPPPAFPCRLLWGGDCALARKGIDAADDGEAALADVVDETHGAQEPRRVVDQDEKGDERNQPEENREEELELRHFRVAELTRRAVGPQQREDEEPHDETDDVVAQQCGRNDARRVLPTGYLDRDE